jgi:hypothetical protein
MKTENQFLTKKNLSQIMFKDDNVFKLCKMKAEYIKDLTFSVFEKDYRGARSLYGVKESGRLFSFMYNEEVIPFKLYLLKNKETMYARFIGFSIDDSSVGFFKKVSSEGEYFDFLEEVKEWLTTFDKFGDHKWFEEKWSKYNVEFDYN